MAEQGMAERLAADLQRSVGGERGRGLGAIARVVHVRAVVHGLELVVESLDGTARASVFVFDTGAIVIQGGEASSLWERLDRWKDRILEAA